LLDERMRAAAVGRKEDLTFDAGLNGDCETQKQGGF
jgi:hypothetical protein